MSCLQADFVDCRFCAYLKDVDVDCDIKKIKESYVHQIVDAVKEDKESKIKLKRMEIISK